MTESALVLKYGALRKWKNLMEPQVFSKAIFPSDAKGTNYATNTINRKGIAKK